ncbi:pore-forming ESAT-6 family protein [Dermabacter vaginalis]|uniref:pore-forming ESAT-6 family protein n=1 Tax=Dermabacter vaginalis TaxID=1630135 RepID=UPI000803AC40|nr:pore-forming ESAT-6 family protein [Dermabacter vaginalis]
MPTTDRISFDTGVSQSVQGDLAGIIGRLEGLISMRDQQVNAAMSDFQADGVSEEYRHVEQRWHRASNEVRGIIDLVKTTMSKNDETATSAQQRAASAVANIG